MLGVEFAKAVADNPMYEEIARQKLQVKLLFAGRVDYAILEGRIFNFYLHELREENIGVDPETTAGRVNYEKEVTFLPMFPAAPYRVGFLDPALRDDFDEGLQALRESGRYTGIFEQYNATRPAP